MCLNINDLILRVLGEKKQLKKRFCVYIRVGGKETVPAQEVHPEFPAVWGG